MGKGLKFKMLFRLFAAKQHYVKKLSLSAQKKQKNGFAYIGTVRRCIKILKFNLNQQKNGAVFPAPLKHIKFSLFLCRCSLGSACIIRIFESFTAFFRGFTVSFFVKSINDGDGGNLFALVHLHHLNALTRPQEC